MKRRATFKASELVRVGCDRCGGYVNRNLETWILTCENCGEYADEQTRSHEQWKARQN